MAAAIHAETAERVAALRARRVAPCITFLRVGDDPASQAYVGMKEKKAKELGIRSETVLFPGGAAEAEVIAQLRALNANGSVHGILVQAPMPGPIREQAVFAAVDPSKDVDGFHPVNAGKLVLGDTTGFRPCTPAGIHELLVRSGIQLRGADVVILGRGNIVGKPMASILMQKAAGCDATVTVAHSRSRDVAAKCRAADVIIAAMGQAKFVKADMVKPGAVVVDVGVNRVEDASAARGYRLVGDVDFEAVKEVAGWITPNPGGVGPMTIAMLMANTVRAAEMAGG